MGNIEHSIKTAEVATWCEGCGPHENLGTCSECGHPIEAGVHPDLASQLRGAVGALQRIASDDCMIVRDDNGTWLDTGAPQRIAQDALTYLGGQ